MVYIIIKNLKENVIAKFLSILVQFHVSLYFYLDDEFGSYIIFSYSSSSNKFITWRAGYFRTLVRIYMCRQS